MSTQTIMDAALVLLLLRPSELPYTATTVSIKHAALLSLVASKLGIAIPLVWDDSNVFLEDCLLKGAEHAIYMWKPLLKPLILSRFPTAMPPSTSKDDPSANVTRNRKLPMMVKPSDSARALLSRKESLAQATSPLLKGQATIVAPTSVEGQYKDALPHLAALHAAHPVENEGRSGVTELANESLLTELTPSPPVEAGVPQAE
jgi:hypothetical protein